MPKQVILHRASIVWQQSCPVPNPSFTIFTAVLDEDLQCQPETRTRAVQHSGTVQNAVSILDLP